MPLSMLLDRLGQGGHQVLSDELVGPLVLGRWAVCDGDRVAAAADFERGAAAEEVAEGEGVHGGRGDDHTEVRPAVRGEEGGR